ncbi:MAG: HlyD family efflux transporter periplasmic adaptor subunit [Oscillospiraceae bacterium]|nr:HlyD family efflux transporter periplasmic adaptor subunit [Oscillospiraceae bacterium]
MTEQKGKKRGWVKNAAIIFLSVMLVLTFLSNTLMNYSLPEVAAQTVQSGTISAKIRGTGTVTANESFEVKSEQTREVLSVPVKVGDDVKVGDVLLHYSEGDSAQVKEAEAALDALVLDYQKALINADDSGSFATEKRAIELAQKALAKAKAEKSANAVTAQQLADAKAAVKKAETELDAQNDKVTDLTEQLSKLTEGTDNSAEIDAKNAEISTAKSTLEAIKLQYATENENITSWAQSWMAASGGTGTLDGYRAALVRELSSRLNYSSHTVTVPSPDNLPDPPAGVSKTDYTTINKMVDAYNTIYTQQQAITLLEAELNSLYVSHGGGSWDYAAVKQQLADAKAKQKTLTTAKEDTDDRLAELEKMKTDYETADKAEDSAQTTYEEALYALEKAQKDSGKQQALDALDIEAKRKQIDDKKEELEDLKGGGEGASVESKVNGKVSAVNISAGKTAEADSVLMTIEVPDMGYVISFSVTTEQSKKVALGDAAEVTNYYYSDPLTATLVGIKSDPQNPTSNKILTFKLQGEVESGVQLSIALGERGGNYETIVPNSSIRTDSNGKFVLAIVTKSSPLGNRYIATRIDVQVLASDDVNSAVSGGITTADFVITTSTKPVDPGTQVRLADNA